MSETLKDSITRLLAQAHAEADANNLSSAIEAASAAHDEWVQAGCPDFEEAAPPSSGGQ